MGSLGKGKGQLTATVTLTQRAYVEARGARLDWRINKVTSRIVEMWFEAGCPPLSMPDAIMPKMPFEATPKAPKTAEHAVNTPPHFATSTAASSRRV